MAAPTVGAVMSDILPYLGVEKNFSADDPAGQSVQLEDFTGLTAKEAEKKLKSLGLGYQAVGTGETVTGQIPAPGSSVQEGDVVLLMFD